MLPIACLIALSLLCFPMCASSARTFQVECLSLCFIGIAPTASCCMLTNVLAAVNPLDRYTRTGHGASGFLSKGSYGKVYLAIDTISQQLVLIKKQRLPDDAAERELLTHMTLLQHPHSNIITLLNYYVTQRSDTQNTDCLALVLPLCDSTLAKAVAARAIHSSDRAEQQSRHVASAVAHLHRLQIIHADLSLANCLVDRDSVVRVADFGSAQSAHSCLAEEMTTPYCRAPERWLGDQGLAPTVDTGR